MADRETNAAPKIPTAELDRLAAEAGMESVLPDGDGSFVWSAGCNGVTAEHLERFAELVTARALAAQAATAEPVAWSYVPSAVWKDTVLTADPKQAQLAREHGRIVTPLYAAPVGQAEDAARYRKMRDWFINGGRRMDIHPDGHMSFTTSAIVDAGVDALPEPAQQAGQAAPGDVDGSR